MQGTKLTSEPPCPIVFLVCAYYAAFPPLLGGFLLLWCYLKPLQHHCPTDSSLLFHVHNTSQTWDNTKGIVTQQLLWWLAFMLLYTAAAAAAAAGGCLRVRQQSVVIIWLRGIMVDSCSHSRDADSFLVCQHTHSKQTMWQTLHERRSCINTGLAPEIVRTNYGSYIVLKSEVI